VIKHQAFCVGKPNTASSSISPVGGGFAFETGAVDRFSGEVNLDPHPLPSAAPAPYLPQADDGPITTAMEIEVAPENQVQFFRLNEGIEVGISA
jgi:hypothetical protein